MIMLQRRTRLGSDGGRADGLSAAAEAATRAELTKVVIPPAAKPRARRRPTKARKRFFIPRLPNPTRSQWPSYGVVNSSLCAVTTRLRVGLRRDRVRGAL